MIFTILRRDVTARIMPLLWILGIYMGYLYAWSANKHFEEYGPHMIPESKTFFEWLIINLFTITIIAFASARMFEVATPFQISLPIRSRDLWLAKIMVVLSVLVGSGLLICGAFWLTYEHPLHPIQKSLAFNALSLAALVPFLYHSVRIRLGTRGMPLWIFVPLMVLIAYGCSLVGMRTMLPGSIALAVAIFLGLLTFFRLPKSFELQVKASEAGQRVSEKLASGFGWLNKIPFVKKLLALDRTLRPGAWFTQKQMIFFLTLTFLLSAFALTLSLYTLVLGYVVLQFAWFARTINGEPRIVHLPLARTRVFYYATLPTLVFLAVLVAVLVTWIPALTWPGVFSSGSVALGVLVYALVWYFTLYLLLAVRQMPPATRAAWRARHFVNPRYWLALAVVAGLGAYQLFGRPSFDGEWRSGLLRDLADSIHADPALFWAATGVVCLAAFFGLRREFLQAETHSTSKEWTRVFS